MITRRFFETPESDWLCDINNNQRAKLFRYSKFHLYQGNKNCISYSRKDMILIDVAAMVKGRWGMQVGAKLSKHCQQVSCDI